MSKFIREQCGFRQEDLAVLMGITLGAVSQWEHGGGAKLQHVDIISKLADTLANMKPTITMQAKHAFAAGYLQGRTAQCQPV